MEENTIMNNEEVMETTEKIAKATSNGGFKKATTIGCKFIVEPAVAKFKIWRANRKIVAQQQDDFCEFEEVETENDSE